MAARALPNIEFVEAKHYRRGQRRTQPLWIVLHATHGAEGIGKARDGALALQRIPSRVAGGNPRSAHLFIDTTAVVQCVPFECEAYHAGPTANQYGEGIELCGRADQTVDDWLDAKSLPMLQLAAHVVRWRADMLRVPLIMRSPEELRRKVSGVTTHAAIAQAFPRDTKHWDPGPGFPVDALLEAARALQPTVA